MKWINLIRLAYRNIISQKTRSLLTVSGIVLGVSFIVVLIGLEYGLQNIVYNQVATSESSKVINVSSERSKILKLKPEHAADFRTITGVESVIEMINFSSKVNYKGYNIDVSSYGVTPGYFDISNLEMLAGSGLPKEAELKKYVVVNKKLIDILIISTPAKAIGEEIDLDPFLDQTINSDINASDISYLEKYSIVGVFDYSNNPVLYLPISNLIDSDVEHLSKVKVVASDPSRIEGIRHKIEEEGFETTSVQDTISELNRVFNIIKILLGVVSFITLFIAVTSILNTLFISIIQRTREVGFLRMVGIRTRDIKLLLIVEAIILSVSGAIGGLILGSSINYGLNTIIRTSDYFNYLGENPSITQFPVYMLVLIIVISVVIGLVTGFYPAQRAIKINPLEALRSHK